VDELTREQAAGELVALMKELEHHDYLYYNEEGPVIADSDYDLLTARSLSIEERSVVGLYVP